MRLRSTADWGSITVRKASSTSRGSRDSTPRCHGETLHLRKTNNNKRDYSIILFKYIRYTRNAHMERSKSGVCLFSARPPPSDVLPRMSQLYVGRCRGGLTECWQRTVVLESLVRNTCTYVSVLGLPALLLVFTCSAFMLEPDQLIFVVFPAH